LVVYEIRPKKLGNPKETFMSEPIAISASVARAKAVRYLQTMLAKKVNFHAAVTLADKAYPQVGKRELITLINYEKGKKQLKTQKA
jgi:hypothetical protein